MNTVEYEYWFNKKTILGKIMTNATVDTIYDTMYNLIAYRMEYANV